MRDIEHKQDKAASKRAEEKKCGVITAGPKAHANEGKPADAAPAAKSAPKKGAAAKGAGKH
jgi:hypothetical protein